MLESEQNTDPLTSDAAADVEQTANPNSESTQHSTATRKLQRVSRAPEDLRAAKLAALKRNQSPASSATNVQKPEDFVGVTLADGRYTVKSQLGKGSMAYVFLAADSRLETDVVVKVPKPEIFTTEDFRERFKRETQLLVKFSHPHVVSVLDIGEFEQLPYVVMQLLSGGSLADHMKNNSNDKGQMGLESLKQWLPGVSRALDFCFRKGMVHRDVKPANILFDEDNNAFVADFGLSKVMYGDHADMNSSETAAGIVLGTPNYISPEIVLAKDYDGRADQYSLGITVYHSLCGKPPMQGKSATATMVNQTQKQLPLLSEVRSDVSERLALVVQKSIEKNPDKRFDCCETFADAVIDALRIPRRNTATAASAVASEQSSPAASGVPRKPKSKLRNSRSSASRRQPAVRATSSSSRPRQAPKKEDLDWLSVPATTALPPRKSKTRKKTPRSKKATGGISVFGQQLSTPLAVAFGASLGLLVVLGAVKAFSSGPETARPTAAGSDTTTANTTGGHPKPAKPAVKQSDSPPNKRGNAAKGNRSNKGKRSPQPATGAASNLWQWKPSFDSAKPSVSQDGMVVTVRPIAKAEDGNPQELHIKVETANSKKDWAQAVIRGLDFALATAFADPAALTKQDLNKLQIEFDYHIPDEIEIGVSLQAGPKADSWADRTLKVSNMMRGTEQGKGHAIIAVADADDAMKDTFLRVMNGDTQRSDFVLKIGVQGRGKGGEGVLRDCEFSVSNLRVVATP